MTNLTSVRVVVLGSKNVGKTAREKQTNKSSKYGAEKAIRWNVGETLTRPLYGVDWIGGSVPSGESIELTVIVRFLTQRYIGEYRSNTDWLYKHNVTCDETSSEVEILDISRWSDDCLPIDEVQSADACIVIYSICDRESFIRAQDCLNLIHRLKAPQYIPVVLLGNKRDLELGRQVSFEDGNELSTQYGCDFSEVSAAGNYAGVNEAFYSLIRQVRTSRHQRSLPRQRKRNIVTVSKVLSAMFRKNSHKDARKNKQTLCSL